MPRYRLLVSLSRLSARLYLKTGLRRVADMLTLGFTVGYEQQYLCHRLSRSPAHTR